MRKAYGHLRGPASDLREAPEIFEIDSPAKMRQSDTGTIKCIKGQGDFPVAAAKKSVGFKRICMSCGTRFYDFGKRPIICPNCSTEFSGEYKVRGGRKSRAVVDPKREEEELKTAQVETGDEENLEEEEELEVVSLEDVEEDGDDDSDEDSAKLSSDEDLDGLPDAFDEDLDEDLEEEEDVLEDDED